MSGDSNFRAPYQLAWLGELTMTFFFQSGVACPAKALRAYTWKLI